MKKLLFLLATVPLLFSVDGNAVPANTEKLPTAAPAVAQNMVMIWLETYCVRVDYNRIHLHLTCQDWVSEAFDSYGYLYDKDGFIAWEGIISCHPFDIPSIDMDIVIYNTNDPSQRYTWVINTYPTIKNYRIEQGITYIPYQHVW